MNETNLNNKIRELEDKLNSLPAGSITKKVIKGNTYYYYRYNEKGKRIEKYIDSSIVPELKDKIELRKGITKELKKLKSDFTINNNSYKVIKNDNTFYSEIIVGDSLESFVSGVKRFKKRECFSQLKDYIYNDVYNKVCILYGLRRTGKTTLIRQAILEMEDKDLKKTVFIQINPKDTLANINKDLRKLETLGYKYIFIDAVTLLEDFIEGAALFSDIYVSKGMKIILSGTDSLGFMFTKSEKLYDRCILLHTTFIPYREFEEVLGITGIDEYIRYGGTMSVSGNLYNQTTIYNLATFSDSNSTNEYIDTSIAKNIQHSLKCYNDGNHFRNLQKLYENGELTNVINRVVEDINHRFTKDVLTKQFKSNDLSLSARNLRQDRTNSTTILDDIDVDKFTNRLKELLNILDINEQKVVLDNAHALEIKEYLLMLDLIYEIKERSFPNINNIKKNIVITQPGLRYAQATSLLESLLLDEKFNNLSLIEKEYISKRILNEIKGRMIEEIVLLETQIANPDKEIFKLKFAIGEYDMVVFDASTLSCEIYEIKYSTEIVKDQYKHLTNQEKNDLTEFKFGKIINKYVIYRGNSTTIEDIKYINIEEYLKSLKNF